jgi:hypothetical protein
VLFGLNNDVDMMHIVLNLVGDEIAKGARFTHGSSTFAALEGYQCLLAEFPQSAFVEHLGQAQHYYGRKFRALQLVWPDVQHHFPWQPLVHPVTVTRQPIFIRPTADARARSAWRWPFAEPASFYCTITMAICTHEGAISFVTRHNGEWTFLSKADDDSPRMQATLGWVFDHEPLVAEIAYLINDGRKVVQR